MQASASSSTDIVIPKAYKDLFIPKRYKVYFGGRGGAKSHNFARALLVKGMEKPLRIICCREIQKSIDDSVHALLSDVIKSHGLEWFYDVQAKKIIGRNGTEIKYRGLRHNTTDLKSLEGADVVWIEEAENVSDNSYEIVIPTVRKEGSEIWVSFNPKNPTDATWRRFVQKHSDRILAKKVSWRDNPFFPKVLEDERRELEQSDHEAYLHIWEGEFDTRYSGAVYAKKIAAIQEQGRVSDKVIHDPAYPVYATFDLGWGDSTAIIFFQLGGGEVFIIDYYESNMEDVRHYAEIMYGKEIIIDDRDLETGEVNKWHFGETLEDHKHRQEYQYHALYMPHDSDHKVLAAGGRSTLSQMKIFDFNAFMVKAASDRDRHQSAWATIPKTWINEEKCSDLIAAMMYYHFEYDVDTKVFKSKPVHDWSSHACSAFELLSRIWTDRSITQSDLDRRAVDNKFHRLRREHNLVQEDPYRTRKRR